MTPLYKSGSFLHKFLAVVAFCVTLLLPQQIEARVLAGSVTERKINRKIDSMLKAARKNYDSGKVQVALENYWKILEIDPQETFAYLELGEIYVGLRIYDRAIELLEPGLTMAQREMDKDTICYYYCILTQAHLALNQIGQANKTLIKAAEAAPKNPMPREILGDIYLANNRPADAIKAYKKAVELDPDSQSAKEKLGAVIAKHGDQPQTRTKDHSAIARKAEPLPPQKPVVTKPAAVSTTPQKIAVAPTKQPQQQRPAIAPEEDEDEDSEEADDEVVEVSSEDGNDEDRAESAAIPDDLTPLPLPAPAKPAETAVTQATQAAPRPMPGAQTSSTQAAAAPKIPATAAVATATEQAAAPEKTGAPAPSASAEEIEGQIDKLLAGTPEDKKAAVSFFLKLEDKGLTEIEELLYDPDPEVRIIAIRTATEFKAFKQRVKTMLEDATDDPDPTVAEEIEKALARL